MKVYELRCVIQNYHWGKKGSASEVAQLRKASDPQFDIAEDETYAELWMGTHPSGMSFIHQANKPDISLADWLKENKSVPGSMHENLPFLFKVLSVNMALSIQAHPDKALGEKLHTEFPNIYKDPNHKPEMAIAITPFEALCCFRPIEEIVNFLNRVPELAAIIGSTAKAELIKGGDTEQNKALLKICFGNLMKADESMIKTKLAELLDRIKHMDSCKEDSASILGGLLQRLHSQFPGDVGCFCIYFMNYVKLKPGEALYLAANEPHAYIYGDCIECMASSDNVVRAGLTPKFKDVPTLLNMLTYVSSPVEHVIFKGKSIDEYTTLWVPPVPEFAVTNVRIPTGIKSYTISALPVANIIIVIKGTAQFKDISLSRGKVLFVSADQDLHIQLDENQGEFVMFRAFANIYI